MAAIKYKVELTEAERSRLNEVLPARQGVSGTVKRALSLLKADQGLRDQPMCCWSATVARGNVEEGLEAAINDRPGRAGSASWTAGRN